MEDLYDPYDPLQMGDSHSQGRTSVEAPTHDPDETPSAIHSRRLGSHSQKISKDKDKNAARMVWVFTWSDIVSYILQSVGLIAAVVFGVWAVRTYNAAKTSLAISTAANDLSTKALTQSVLANQLGLVTFCASIQAGPPSNFTTPCATVSQYFLSSVIDGVGPPPPGETTEPDHAKTTVHFAVTVGTIVGVVVLFVAAGALLHGRKRLRISLVEDNC